MVIVREDSVRRLGFWSAVLCTIFSLAYVAAQLAEWAGLLGSAGGQTTGPAPGVEPSAQPRTAAC